MSATDSVSPELPADKLAAIEKRDQTMKVASKWRPLCPMAPIRGWCC